MKFNWISEISKNAIMHAYNIILSIDETDVETLINIAGMIKSMPDIDDNDKHGLMCIIKSLFTFDSRGLILYGLKEAIAEMYVSAECIENVCIRRCNGMGSTDLFMNINTFESMNMFNVMIRIFYLLNLNPSIQVDHEGTVQIVITVKGEK